MHIGILQVELAIAEAGCLKDKRRVVQSIKQRLGRRIDLAVAEVGHLQVHTKAFLGFTTVANNGAHIGQVIQSVLQWLQADPRFELVDHQVEILSGDG